MARDYELMYIVRPELDDEAVRGAVKSVRALIEAQGGEVVKTTLWGRRRLAYEVGRLRDGHYVLVVLRLDGAKVAPVAAALKIHETVFRHMITEHQGPMPEPDGELEEAHFEPPPDAEEAAGDGPVVAAVSAQTAQDDGDDLDEAPSASDDEGDE